MTQLNKGDVDIMDKPNKIRKIKIFEYVEVEDTFWGLQDEVNEFLESKGDDVISVTQHQVLPSITVEYWEAVK